MADWLAAQAAEAARIARIPQQHLLDEPETNPATRATLEALRSRQHAAELHLRRQEIDIEVAGRAEELRANAALYHQQLQARLDEARFAAHHSRAEREAAQARAERARRAADHAADNAERVAEARRAACEHALHEVLVLREETSATHRLSVLRADRFRFMAGALAATALLGIGSGYGMGLVASALGIATPVGWATEAGLTGLSVVAITYRARLRAAQGQVNGWRNILLWALFTVPLAASVAITGTAALTATQAPTGLILAAIAALGSAAFAALAHLISDISADAINQANTAIHQSDLDRLEAQATRTRPTPPPPSVENPPSAAAGQLPRLLRRVPSQPQSPTPPGTTGKRASQSSPLLKPGSHDVAGGVENTHATRNGSAEAVHTEDDARGDAPRHHPRPKAPTRARHDAVTRPHTVAIHADAGGHPRQDPQRAAPGDAPKNGASPNRAPGASPGFRTVSPPTHGGAAQVTVEQVHAFFATHPETSNRGAARHFGISEATIRRRRKHTPQPPPHRSDSR